MAKKESAANDAAQIQNILDQFRAGQTDENYNPSMDEVADIVLKLQGLGMDKHAAAHTLTSIAVEEGVFDPEDAGVVENDLEDRTQQAAE